MVSVLKQVDIVISVLPVSAIPDQIKIIDAIIAAGNIEVNSLLFLARDFESGLVFFLRFCCPRGSYHLSSGVKRTGSPHSHHSKHYWRRRRKSGGSSKHRPFPTLSSPPIATPRTSSIFYFTLTTHDLTLLSMGLARQRVFLQCLSAIVY